MTYDVSRESGVVYESDGYRMKIESEKPFASLSQNFTTGVIGGCYTALLFRNNVLFAESLPAVLKTLPQEMVFQFAPPVEHHQQEFKVRYFRVEDNGRLIRTDIQVEEQR